MHDTQQICRDKGVTSSRLIQFLSGRKTGVCTGAHAIDKTDDALYMRVRGSKFAGRVGVHYHYPSDLYIVRSYRRNGETGEAEIAEEWKDVFAEDLVPVLDAVIG